MPKQEIKLDLESRPFTGHTTGMVEAWRIELDPIRCDQWGRPSKIVEILVRDPETGELVTEFMDSADLPGFKRLQPFFSQS